MTDKEGGEGREDEVPDAPKSDDPLKPKADEPQTLETYRIEQLEQKIRELEASGGALSLGQIKEMFFWIGLPVAVATSIFGAALWIVITSLAEGKADERARDVADKVSRLIAQSVAKTTAKEAATQAALQPAKDAAEALVQQLTPKLEQTARDAAVDVAGRTARDQARQVAVDVARSAAAEAASNRAEIVAAEISSKSVRDIEARVVQIAKESARATANEVAPEAAANAGLRQAMEIAQDVAESQATIAATRIAQDVARNVASNAAQQIVHEEIVSELVGNDRFVRRASDALTEIVEGAVVAFPFECREDLGWKPYFPAAGRFVVGAGRHHEEDGEPKNLDAVGEPLTIYAGPSDLSAVTLQRPRAANDAGDFRIGGVETHTLTVDEMPAHSHPGSRIATGGPVIENANRGGVSFRVDVGQAGDRILSPVSDIVPVIESQGGGQPHNNMPPYIALYFCKKEG